MLKQSYEWKRFWCHPTGNISLADSGYLLDPDTDWGKAGNPELVTLETISDIPCLVLLGEPGIGKSQEMQRLKALTEQKIYGNSQILECNLRSCTNLREDLFKDEIFIDWLKGKHHLYLFLDSLDEGLLSIPNISQALLDELKKPKYKNHISRLNLRLACRTFVFPEFLEQGFKEIWNQDNVGIYELVPLRRVDVIEAAEVEGFSTDIFLKEIRQKDIVSLAIKPVTLKFLLKIYHYHNGQFPPNQKLHELYYEGCKHLCEEINQSRRASNQIGALNTEQRVIVAARIAAVTMFSNRFAVWTGIDQGDVQNEDVLLEKLCHAYEHANGREFEITREVIQEVLDTGLFSARGTSRMGWAHQTYAEFLAAWYLFHHKISLTKIRELIFSSEDPEHKLIPQLHETVAWLASLRRDVLEEIIKTDPNVVLQSDVPTDAQVRQSIVDELLKQCEQETLFNTKFGKYERYVKLKHPGLAQQLRPYICDSTKSIYARDVAIDIAESCEVHELQEQLINLAFDASQPIQLRESAVHTISSIGDAKTKKKLKPLAIEEISEDENDQLKGYALQALWPDHLAMEELFQALTPPKKRNFFGGYQFFLKFQLVSNLQTDHLAFALSWLKKQGVRCFGHPFEDLGDNLLWVAWQNFDLPEVPTNFAKVALVQWKEHQPLISNNSQLRQKFTQSLWNELEKRRTLLEQVVLLIATTGEDIEDVIMLSYSVTENIISSKDVVWMIERLKHSCNETTQRVWARLVELNFNRQDAQHIDEIIKGTQTNTVLCEVFAPELEPIQLDSPKAEKLKADYIKFQQMEQERQNRRQALTLVDPPPKERVVKCLERLEAGNLQAWWQLTREMTLKHNSRFYDNELELNLTQLPGWQEAEIDTRERIVEGAKKYIQNQNEIDYDWIATNQYNLPALGGCKGLELLLKENSDFLNTLSSEIWKQWAPVIVAVPNRNTKDNSYLELVKLAYLNAPDQCIETLIKLIDKENQESHSIFVIDRFAKCWDERLTSTLLEKVKDPSLKLECFGDLLEELLKQEVDEARDYAKSLISLPLPLDESERKKALISSRVLIQNSDPYSWSYIWSLIQQDSSFGREVLESTPKLRVSEMQLNLTEVQLADLYIWLVNEYPYEEDNDYSNEVMAHCVTRRDEIARFRDKVLEQLKEQGTCEACNQIKRLIQELPNQEWLKITLIRAKENMRRQTWQPPEPLDIIQLGMKSKISLSDILDKINHIIEIITKMPKFPRFNISDNSNSNININTGENGKAEQKVEKPEKKINWSGWISILVGLMTIGASGLFNTEIKELLEKVTQENTQNRRDSQQRESN